MLPVNLVGDLPTLRFPVLRRHFNSLGPHRLSVLRPLGLPHCHFNFYTYTSYIVFGSFADLISDSREDTPSIALSIARSE